jgi:hypothetical protein
MKTRLKWAVIGAAVLGLGVAGYAFTASSQENHGHFRPPFMRHGGMNHDMSGMMGPDMARGPMAHDAATMTQLGAIHELFTNHDRIRRTVTNLSDGIRTETTSDDPRIAELIKKHVTEMDRRVKAGDDPGLPIESEALHAIFRNKDKIKTSIETIPNGVAVVQTSTDAAAVATLQEHAAQVTEFVKEGMPAMHTAMMRNAGAMPSRIMGSGMMGPGIMGGGPMHRETPSQAPNR